MTNYNVIIHTSDGRSLRCFMTSAMLKKFEHGKLKPSIQIPLDTGPIMTVCTDHIVSIIKLEPVSVN